MKTHQSTTEPVTHNNKDLFFGGMQKAGSFFAPTVQPKLTVNEPGDEYEQEADRLADQVMRMKDGDAPVVQRTSLGTGSGIMRKCDACEKEEEKKLHRKESGSGDAGGKAAPAVVSNVLSSGGGQPMDGGTRQFMESRFGQDFSSVRIHSDSRAADSAAAIQARAYTSGRDIVFGAGEYRPGSDEGRRLLAHELVHVGQQGADSTLLFRISQTKVEETNRQELLQQEKGESARLLISSHEMDQAAKLLALKKIPFYGKKGFVFIGFQPTFIKVYNQKGIAISKSLPIDGSLLDFIPGVYIFIENDSLFHALTESTSGNLNYGIEDKSWFYIRKYSSEEVTARKEEAKKSPMDLNPIMIEDLLVNTQDKKIISDITNAEYIVIFVPNLNTGGSGKNNRERYVSPIRTGGDLKPNAPSWPVSIFGPEKIPIGSNPTFVSKINWSANGNDTTVAQVISQVGIPILYRWELFKYTGLPSKLEQETEKFKVSEPGTGIYLTPNDGADHEFGRAFENWYVDTERAREGAYKFKGDTIQEKLVNAAANKLALELSNFSLFTTTFGATLIWTTETILPSRKDQMEIPFNEEGIYLVRVIATPANTKDRNDNLIIRPSTVDVVVTEAMPMEKIMKEVLKQEDERLEELQVIIDNQIGFEDKDYRSRIVSEKDRLEGSPLTVLIRAKDEKELELAKVREKYPFMRVRIERSLETEVRHLKQLIDNYQKSRKYAYEQQAESTAVCFDPLKRLRATLISSETGEKYPLLLSASSLQINEGEHHWMISDFTDRTGKRYEGYGRTQSAALRSALTKFGNDAKYGRGFIGVITAGLKLEDGAPAEIFVDSNYANVKLVEKRIEDLVTTLVLLGLIIPTAGTVGVFVGAGVAAARLIKRWEDGQLYLDDNQVIDDFLAVLGGLGKTAELTSKLFVIKVKTKFVIIERGRFLVDGAEKLEKAVARFNEFTDFGGIMWGNYKFISEIRDINSKERNGDIKHSEARRRRINLTLQAIKENSLYTGGKILGARRTHADTQDKSVTDDSHGDKGELKSNIESTSEPTPTQRTYPNTNSTESSVSAENTAVSKNDNQSSKPDMPLVAESPTLVESNSPPLSDTQIQSVADDSLNGDKAKVDNSINSATDPLQPSRVTTRSKSKRLHKSIPKKGSLGDRRLSSRAVTTNESRRAREFPTTVEQSLMIQSLISKYPGLIDKVAKIAIEDAESVAGSGVAGAGIRLKKGRELTVFNGELTSQGLFSRLISKANKVGVIEIFVQVNSRGATKQAVIKLVSNKAFPDLEGKKVRIFGPDGEAWVSKTFKPVKKARRKIRRK